MFGSVFGRILTLVISGKKKKDSGGPPGSPRGACATRTPGQRRKKCYRLESNVHITDPPPLLLSPVRVVVSLELVVLYQVYCMVTITFTFQVVSYMLPLSCIVDIPWSQGSFSVLPPGAMHALVCVPRRQGSLSIPSAPRFLLNFADWRSLSRSHRRKNSF